MVRILIIGGGGIFGVIPVEFLKHVGVMDVRGLVNVIGGTSIGGICAMYLAHGKSAQSLHYHFYESVADIFDKPWFRSWNFYRSAYPASNIEPFLQEHLTQKLGELKIPTIIPTLDFKEEKPKIFDNIVKDEDLLVPTWKIGRATSAAPTFFPPFEIDGRILLDGGIVENIPIMTVTTAVKDKMNIDFKDMKVLVMGTGEKLREEKTIDSVRKYSPITWLRKLLVPFVTKSNEIASHYWARRLDFNFYSYFNPVTIEGSMDEDEQVTSGLLSEKCSYYMKDFEMVWEEFMK